MAVLDLLADLFADATPAESADSAEPRINTGLAACGQLADDCGYPADASARPQNPQPIRNAETRASIGRPQNPQHPQAYDADACSHWRLPDGREVWTSPPETREQVQSRHPGAEPLPDTVTVTEPDTDDERQAIEYAERIARLREDGRVPDSYTGQTVCQGCGLVWIFQGAPSRVDSCPWCFNRAKGLPIPRPAVSCADCRHFTPDPVGHGGIGQCAAGGPPQGQMPAYPHATRQCGQFRPKELSQ